MPKTPGFMLRRVQFAGILLLIGCGGAVEDEMYYPAAESTGEQEFLYEGNRYFSEERDAYTDSGYDGGYDGGYHDSKDGVSQLATELPYDQTAPESKSTHYQFRYTDMERPPLQTDRQRPIPRTTPGTESYERIVESAYRSVRQHPRSTFSIDVDTASYANMRRFLEQGQIPPKDAIRIEELINYFSYNDPAPSMVDLFRLTPKWQSALWDSERKLVRIGIKGQEVEVAERQPANLVFLIDVSGSMRPENKLPLIQRSLHRLLEELGERDRVAIVTYASGVHVPLPSVPANQQHRIAKAIDNLVAGGSTNGSAGLRVAYDVARQHFSEFGTNRVILCSDGDFNVGITNESELVQFIEHQAKSRVFLSVLGFGTGNYKDSLAEKLADHGNGNYAYIDSYAEARKVLIDQMTATLETIAKDVKIQVEFNPALVATYRLIGYENRKMADRDFRNDHKDAGEIGAGHSVSALYEVIPTGAESPFPDLPELRYQQPVSVVAGEHSDELLTVRMRYKLPRSDHATEFGAPCAQGSKAVRSRESELPVRHSRCHIWNDPARFAICSRSFLAETAKLGQDFNWIGSTRIQDGVLELD